MFKRSLWLLVKYGVGFGLLAWVVASNWHLASPTGEDVGLAAALQRPVQPARFVLALAFSGLATASTFCPLVRSCPRQDLPFAPADALRLGLLGYFLNTFMPGTIGGDLVKAALVAREQRRRTVAVSTVLFDRVVGMSGIYTLAVGAGTLLWLTGGLDESFEAEEKTRTVLLTGLAAALAVLVALVVGWGLLQLVPERGFAWVERQLPRVPRVGRHLAELWRAVWIYRTRRAAVAAAWLLSLANHACSAVTVYFAATTLLPLDDVPPLALHFVLVPIGTTVQASVPLPSGVGVAEAAFGALYELIGYSFAAGVLAALTTRATTWILGFAGYLVYLRMRRATEPKGEPGA